MPAPSQVFLSQLLRVLAGTGDLPEELIWEHITNHEWSSPVLRRLTPPALETLADTLIEYQTQRAGKWASSIPHLFASVILESDCDAERRRLLFAFCVVCSINAGTVSALERVFRSEARWSLEREIRYWARSCEDLYSYGLPWVQSRLRPVLCSLSRAATYHRQQEEGEPDEEGIIGHPSPL